MGIFVIEVIATIVMMLVVGLIAFFKDTFRPVRVISCALLILLYGLIMTAIIIDNTKGTLATPKAEVAYETLALPENSKILRLRNTDGEKAYYLFSCKDLLNGCKSLPETRKAFYLMKIHPHNEILKPKFRVIAER
jgi:hypothetical protein